MFYGIDLEVAVVVIKAVSALALVMIPVIKGVPFAEWN